MKKSPSVLNTPVSVLLAMLAIVLVGEFLIILPQESVRTAILRDVVLNKWLFEFIASVALCRQIFGPMNAKHAERVWQNNELCCIQKVTFGRELRMKELVEELAALCAIRLSSKKSTTSNSRRVLWKKRTTRQSSPESRRWKKNNAAPRRLN